VIGLRYYTVLLSVVVIVFGAFLGLYWVEAQGAQESSIGGGDSVGRNDRSTPPTFILPATPAVAREQQLRLWEHANKAEANMLVKCSAELNIKGYSVRGELVTFNAELVEATYLYQRDHGLPATGRLNGTTRSALGC